MSDTRIEAGDVVELKSGGPKMTVEGVGSYGLPGGKLRAKCYWFEGAKQMENVFGVEVLKKVE